jgi:hypothetical protein
MSRHGLNFRQIEHDYHARSAVGPQHSMLWATSCRSRHRLAQRYASPEDSANGTRNVCLPLEHGEVLIGRKTLSIRTCPGSSRCWKMQEQGCFQAHCFCSWCMNDTVWPSQILDAFLSSKKWFVLTPSSRQGLARPIRPYECQALRIIQPGHLWSWRWIFGHESFPPIYLIWRWFWGVARNVCLVK